MKRIPTDLILALLLLGVVIGIFYSRWMAMESQVANHDTRLRVLEADHNKRMQVKACATRVLGFASKCVHKLTFGVVKLH